MDRRRIGKLNYICRTSLHEFLFEGEEQNPGSRRGALPAGDNTGYLNEATMVELFHHGFERLGAEAADNLQGYEEGWDVKHLKALRSIVEQ